MVLGFQDFSWKPLTLGKLRKMNYHVRIVTLLLLVVTFFLPGCEKEDEAPRLELVSVKLGTYEMSTTNPNLNSAAPLTGAFVIVFSQSVDPASVDENISLLQQGVTGSLPLTSSLSNNNTTVTLEADASLQPDTQFQLVIGSSLAGAQGQKLGQQKIVEFRTEVVAMNVLSILVNEKELRNVPHVTDVDPLDVEIRITFSNQLNAETVTSANIFVTGPNISSLQPQLSEGNIVSFTITSPLKDWSKYQLTITSALKGTGGESMSQLTRAFFTRNNGIADFPILSDDALLTLVQQQTFKYFWDFAHPASGMARERNTSGNLVTSGGSGFGLMAIIVGIERNFITRQEGIERLDRILTFLENADRFHGAWSHWIDGNSGNVIPFSTNDDGGDLVETALLVQGLLTFRQYLNTASPAENDLVNRINNLWESVEWDWYTRNGQKVLYWHWSPSKEWAMNHQIRGHNETLITYVLAASSPTHTITADVYHEGYARSGAIKNGNSYYDITLPLGEALGGPLFFSHYSFLGLDPRNLEDQYANYWTQNRNHTLINQAYVLANPLKYAGYTEESWGLTASDNHEGYSAHSPNNDRGVITPTAALSSFPYTPEESMKALHFFYYNIGDRLWGQYGFYDAYNITAGWVANSYLAIDQGPIIVMIENYRTGLLWDLFMSAPEVQTGLEKLDFTY